MASTTFVNGVTLTDEDWFNEADEVIYTGQEPGGRLTLTTAVPVLTSSVTGATTVYYTPYKGRKIPIYDGTDMFVMDFGGELSQATTDSTKSPAAVGTSSNYDVFVWNDSGTFRATRGPAWSSGTARGTGAGTTELVMVEGILLNAVAITNGPGAQRGTYVGTIRSNASSTIDFIFGALAASGTAGVLNVWNAYNRVDVASVSRDSTDSWAYTTLTWRSANNSATMRTSFVIGLNEDIVRATYTVLSLNVSAGIARYCGCGLDTTTAFTGVPGISGGAASDITQMTAIFNGLPGLGSHFIQATEISTASGTTTWYGDNAAATLVQNGLSVLLRM